MAVQTEFMSAINQISAERGIDGDEVLRAVAEAIATGFRKNYPEDLDIEIKVNIDPDEGQISVIFVKKVVETVSEENEISLADAQEIDAEAEVGDMIDVDITAEGDFGRVAAQAARQVIMQKIRETEREVQLEQYKDKIGEIEFAVVQRMDRDNVVWEVGKTFAVMPADDRIPGEYYKSGSRHKVLLKEIAEMPRGKTLIVSRSDPEFLIALFRLEVPELTSESVEIKSVAREAGSRSKIAVHSDVDGIDPIGSCVGQKGIRINSIMNELRIGNREEKIDIILWDEDIARFLANSISPANAVKVEIVDEEEKEAKIIVPEDHLSLAIGKDGQNVRLAAKLTGWKLDIEGQEGTTEDAGQDGEEEVVEGDESSSESDSKDIQSLDVSTRTKTALENAGIKTLDDLKEHADNLKEIDGIGPKSAEELNKYV